MGGTIRSDKKLRGNANLAITSKTPLNGDLLPGSASPSSQKASKYVVGSETLVEPQPPTYSRQQLPCVDVEPGNRRNFKTGQLPPSIADESLVDYGVASSIPLEVISQMSQHTGLSTFAIKPSISLPNPPDGPPNSRFGRRAPSSSPMKAKPNQVKYNLSVCGDASPAQPASDGEPETPTDAALSSHEGHVRVSHGEGDSASPSESSKASSSPFVKFPYTDIRPQPPPSGNSRSSIGTPQRTGGSNGAPLAPAKALLTNSSSGKSTSGADPAACMSSKATHSTVSSTGPRTPALVHHPPALRRTLTVVMDPVESHIPPLPPNSQDQARRRSTERLLRFATVITPALMGKEDLFPLAESTAAMSTLSENGAWTEAGVGVGVCVGGASSATAGDPDRVSDSSLTINDLADIFTPEPGEGRKRAYTGGRGAPAADRPLDYLRSSLESVERAAESALSPTSRRVSIIHEATQGLLVDLEDKHCKSQALMAELEALLASTSQPAARPTSSFVQVEPIPDSPPSELEEDTGPSLIHRYRSALDLNDDFCITGWRSNANSNAGGNIPHRQVVSAFGFMDTSMCVSSTLAASFAPKMHSVSSAPSIVGMLDESVATYSTADGHTGYLLSDLGTHTFPQRRQPRDQAGRTLVKVPSRQNGSAVGGVSFSDQVTEVLPSSAGGGSRLPFDSASRSLSQQSSRGGLNAAAAAAASGSLMASSARSLRFSASGAPCSAYPARLSACGSQDVLGSSFAAEGTPERGARVTKEVNFSSASSRVASSPGPYLVSQSSTGPGGSTSSPLVLFSSVSSSAPQASFLTSDLPSDYYPQLDDGDTWGHVPPPPPPPPPQLSSNASRAPSFRVGAYKTVGGDGSQPLMASLPGEGLGRRQSKRLNSVPFKEGAFPGHPFHGDNGPISILPSVATQQATGSRLSGADLDSLVHDQHLRGEPPRLDSSSPAAKPGGGPPESKGGFEGRFSKIINKFLLKPLDNLSRSSRNTPSPSTSTSAAGDATTTTQSFHGIAPSPSTAPSTVSAQRQPAAPVPSPAPSFQLPPAPLRQGGQVSTVPRPTTPTTTSHSTTDGATLYPSIAPGKDIPGVGSGSQPYTRTDSGSLVSSFFTPSLPGLSPGATGPRGSGGVRNRELAMPSAPVSVSASFPIPVHSSLRRMNAGNCNSVLSSSAVGAVAAPPSVMAPSSAANPLVHVGPRHLHPQGMGTGMDPAPRGFVGRTRGAPLATEQLSI